MWQKLLDSPLWWAALSSLAFLNVVLDRTTGARLFWAVLLVGDIFWLRDSMRMPLTHDREKHG